MSFKLKLEELTELFNPDNVHRGVSLDKLKKLGKIPALEGLLKTNFNKGLLNDQKQQFNRRQFYGANHPIIRQPKTLWELINQNFEDQLIRLMVAAGLVSLTLGILTEGLKWGWIQGFSIFFAVALVIFLSSIDDFAHQKQFELIKGQNNQKNVRVYRSGKLFQLEVQQLMVGDIIQVMGGDRIYVDGVLIYGEDLMVDQSQITGEAVEVKKRVPMSYDRNEGADPFLISSSQVMTGMGIMLVLAVGQHSYYGNLLTKMQVEHIDSPLRLKITDLSNEINDLGLVVAIITFSSLILHYLYGCFLNQNPLDHIFSGESLHKLVDAILITFTIDVALPQTLPLSVTIALAHTAKRLQKQQIFVKYLNQSQTMGGIDNLCLTKTGFITKNLLQVAEIYVEQKLTQIISREAMSEDTCRILNMGIVMNSLASPKFVEQNGNTLKIQHVGNKTQSALLQMAYKMGYNYERFRISSAVKRIYSTGHPKKKMATVYRDERGKLFLFVKGSPMFLLPYCSFYINRYQQIAPITPSIMKKLQNIMIHFNNANLKIVMVVYKQVNSVPTKWSQVQKNLIMIAMIGIKDFLRQNVKSTINQCQNSGICVRLLTNQSRHTAIGAAKQAGILSNDWIQTSSDYTAVEGCDFRQLVGGLLKFDPNHIQYEQKKVALQNFKLIKESLKIIYRASAQDKLLLTVGLSQCGHVVAMAGNGTNDTEALRKADVSISMARTGNQSAKQASDIVFLDDNFASILKTIHWGRHTYNSIRKFLVLQLTINLVAAMMALLGAIFLGESPLNPIQMLWTNLIIDVTGSIALILEKPRQRQISKTPYPRRDKILTPSMMRMIIIQALAQVVILSIILFFGPQLFGVVSSIGVDQWSKQTGKHYSLFFNTFIMLQIFNQFNSRELIFQKINIFQGLLREPMFICFTLSSFIIQFLSVKYIGKWLQLTELSFNQNLLCFIFGSISIFSNYVFKNILPENISITSKKIEFGFFRYDWSDTGADNEEEKVPQIVIHPYDTMTQIMSPQFSQFMIRRKNKYLGYSYLQPKDSLKQSLDQDEQDHFSI